MAINSCLYETHLMHCRIRPKRHQFTNQTFMFYLDLDELDVLPKQCVMFSHNKANIYNFRDDDHFKEDGLGIKDKLLAFLSSKGVVGQIGKIMILTNLRTFGYIFNPVSFYFCFDPRGLPVCVVPEIGNTFGEIKPFYIGPEAFRDGHFVSAQKKYYYISPFIGLDIPMEFRLSVPDEDLNIKIDDFDAQGKFLYTVMSGKRKEMTNSNLWWMTMKYPFITLKVILLIHWHALWLWLKQVGYHEKTSDPHLQKEVYRVWSKGKENLKSTYA